MIAALTLLIAAKTSYAFTGMYVEGCSCQNACTFELTGKNPGCKAVGFFQFASGKFGGRSLAGGKVAYAAGSNGWVRLYYDGPSEAVRSASRDFIVAALKDWGKPEAVLPRSISIAGWNGTYIAQIDDGKVMQLETEPVMATNSDQPITYRHIFNSAMHPTIMQAHTTACRFADGERKLSFGPSNGFFNTSIHASASF
jgi:hypothetical protein